MERERKPLLGKLRSRIACWCWPGQWGGAKAEASPGARHGSPEARDPEGRKAFSVGEVWVALRKITPGAQTARGARTSLSPGGHARLKLTDRCSGNALKAKTEK